MTDQAAATLRPHLRASDANMLSVHGTLLLGGSMAAARADNRAVTNDFLNEAAHMAQQLGRDANHVWTAFGPTNVSIHRVSTAMELGDIQLAVELGPRVDTAALPAERRVRHALEVARGLNMRNQQDEALAALLAAEEIAPEQVRYHFISRHLVQNWMRKQRGKPSFQLAGLAGRLGVL